MPQSDQIASPMDSLIADFNLSIRRLAETPLKSIKDINDELRLNLYPSLIAIAEQVAEVDEVMQEVVEHQESYIHPQLTAQIFQTIAIALELTKEVKALELDDFTKKKLTKLITAFEHSAELTAMGVNEATTDIDDDDDDDDDDDNDDDNADDNADDDDDSDTDDTDSDNNDDAPPVIEGETEES